MALGRFKFLPSFLTKEKDEEGGVEAPSLPIESKEREDIRENPVEIEEILNGMDQAYMTDEEMDPNQYVLDKLPDELNSQALLEQVLKLRQELDAVSKKLSDLVLENHASYVEELQRVTDIQNALQMATMVCLNGRRQLAQSKKDVTKGGLGVLSNHRKRLKIQQIMRTLRTIKTLQRTDIRTQEMLEEEDYPAAIQLCLECQQAIKSYKKYHCVSELGSKLQDTQVEIEDQLDRVLAQSCTAFDAHRYDRVQTAYRLLSKSQMAMDQLLMHYTQTLHNRSFSIVLQFAERCRHDAKSGPLNRLPYKDLCSKMDSKYFVPCLIELCKSLWEVLHCYHRTVKWHERQDKMMDEDEALRNDAELQYNRSYINKKLEHGKTKIWQDVKQRVKPYLLGTDLSSFQFDNFIAVLNVTNRLISVGEEVCGDKSADLQDSVRLQSLNYFKSFHRVRMDELRMFLENEMWDVWPVRASFTIYSLKEFSFLRSSSTLSPTTKIRNLTDGFFMRFSQHGNPFDDADEEDVAEEPLVVADENSPRATRRLAGDDDEDDDEPEELKRDFVDEGDHHAPTKKSKRPQPGHGKVEEAMEGPICTNTTLGVMRLFGKYMRMMDVLKPIAYDVMIFLSQLFDYYMYAVHSFFARDVAVADSGPLSLSSKMKTTLKRIENNLILHMDSAGVPLSSVTDEIRVQAPALSTMIPLDQLSSLYGLTRRMTAVESLVFLASQFESLLPHLEVFVPQSKRAFLSQFHSQTVSIVPELRQPVYCGVADKMLDTGRLLQQMSSVKWDIRDIMSQHSHYIDYILTECQVLKRRVDEWNSITPMPKVVLNVVWAHILHTINHTFVEGFASAKKCSNEGRALMQLDFQQFIIQIEKLLTLRPIPEREFVDTYIKAFYMSEADIEPWLRDHRMYSTKQLTSLVQCGVGAHINKKAKNRLINLIEDMEKTRRPM
ncbi:syndetin-like [Sycon ciliatum]|uniref:syndetin-like n=1 Tax=Sycon ciliatum TaxID=27933 RepID=UPI0020AAE932|eukprot:scpid33005/ scgid23035/ Coiled-coil domain-containing protein 132